MQDLVVRKYKIKLPTGIHVRTASTIVKLVGNYKCRVFIKKGSMKIAADSPIKILTLGIQEKDEVEVEFKGEDCEILARAFDEMVNEKNFNE